MTLWIVIPVVLFYVLFLWPLLRSAALADQEIERQSQIRKEVD